MRWDWLFEIDWAGVEDSLFKKVRHWDESQFLKKDWAKLFDFLRIVKDSDRIASETHHSPIEFIT